MSLVKKVERRILEQINSEAQIIDLKIDLLEHIKSSINLFNKENENKDEIGKHKFRLAELGKQDALLMQMPNINESGYYAGIVALYSYIKKFHSSLPL